MFTGYLSGLFLYVCSSCRLLWHPFRVSFCLQCYFALYCTLYFSLLNVGEYVYSQFTTFFTPCFSILYFYCVIHAILEIAFLNVFCCSYSYGILHYWYRVIIDCFWVLYLIIFEIMFVCQVILSIIFNNPISFVMGHLLTYVRHFQHDFRTVCVSRRKYNQYGGHRLVNIESGNYTYKIAAISLSGNGSFTPLKNFVISTRLSKRFS